MKYNRKNFVSQFCFYPDTLSMFIAVGPFTTSESDSYEPLTDFLNQVLQEDPDLVIMVCWSIICWFLIKSMIDAYC
jgi:hypothetical protein